MVLQPGVHLADDLPGIHSGLEDEHGANAVCADHRGFADSGQAVQHGLDIFGKDLEPFGSDDNVLLAAANHQIAPGVKFPQIAGVKPAIAEGSGGLFRQFEVSGSHVIAANQDFAVPCDFYVHACERFSRGPALDVKGMAEADDGRGLGEAVTLDDHEAQVLPELFQVRGEGRASRNEAAEFPAEQAMYGAETPPAARP